MRRIRTDNKTGLEKKKEVKKMKIIEKKEGQTAIKVDEEYTTIFSDETEIHNVSIKIGETRLYLTVHKDGHDLSGSKITIHGLNETDLSIFDKVSKKYTKYDGTSWTKIKVVSE